MDFDYLELGKSLSEIREKKNMRQIDLEILSDGKLKQPAVSAAEHGETRLALDTFILYCNTLGVRPETVLEPYITASPESDESGAIVDAYVVRIAAIMSECLPDTKKDILQIAALLKNRSQVNQQKIKKLQNEILWLKESTEQ